MSVEKTTQAIELLLRSMIQLPEGTARDQNLMEYGLDAIYTIRLVAELEEIFNIMFNDNELRFENFNTIKNIVQNVIRRVSNSVLETN